MERNEYLQLADWRRRTAEIYARWRDEAQLDPEGATLRLRGARGDMFHEHPQSPLPVEGRSRFAGLSYWSYDPAYRMRAFLEPPEGELVRPLLPGQRYPDAAREPPAAAGERVDTHASAREPAAGASAPETPASTSRFSLSEAYRSAASLPGLHWPTSARSAPSPTAAAEAPAIQLPASGDEPFAFRRIGRVRLTGPLAGETLFVFWMEGYAGGLFIPFRDATSGSETYAAGRYLLDTAKGADHGGDHASGELLLDFNLAYHPSCAYDARWNCPLAPVENTLREHVRVGERLA